MIESRKAGRTATRTLVCVLIAAILVSLGWVWFFGTLVGAGIALGVPWLTAAVAATSIHLLAVTLVVLAGIRLGRSLLRSAERRLQAIEAEGK